MASKINKFQNFWKHLGRQHFFLLLCLGLTCTLLFVSLEKGVAQAQDTSTVGSSSSPSVVVSPSTPQSTAISSPSPGAVISPSIPQSTVSPNSSSIVTRPPTPRIRTTALVAAIALGFTLVILVPIYGLSPKLFNSDQARAKKHCFWTILDPQTNTYSLARAQFVWWLNILVFSYLFLFVGRGLVHQVWAFIPLSGFLYTLMISLGTLLAAQATSQIRGNKGSGEVHPAFSDLIIHGGVVALERVQQVVWNLITGIIFIVILVTTYHTASSLPNIPNELTAFLGVSAAGYVSGKAIRMPGPVINQVVLYGDPTAVLDGTAKDETAQKGKAYLTISGDNFSQGGQKGYLDATKTATKTNRELKDGGVIIQITFPKESSQDDTATLIEVNKDSIITLDYSSESNGEFCRKLKIDFADLEKQQLPEHYLDRIYKNYSIKGAIKITVINADGQRAVWDGSTSSLPPERQGSSPITSDIN